MAKKPENLNLETGERNGASAPQKEVVKPKRVLIDAAKIAAARQYARENDAFNVTLPTPGAEYLVQLEGIDQVMVKNRESFIGRFRNLETGEAQRFWLSGWFVKELAEKDLETSGLPMLMTYQGRKASKKSVGTFNAWARHYFTVDEANQLGLIPHEERV